MVGTKITDDVGDVTEINGGFPTFHEQLTVGIYDGPLVDVAIMLKMDMLIPFLRYITRRIRLELELDSKFPRLEYFR